VAPEMLEEKILEGLEKGLEHFPVGDFWSMVAREIFLKIMPALKEQETDIRIEGFSPYMVEKSIKAEVRSLKLRGKIDRVDIKSDGGRNSVILLDYKTGGIDKDSLQLPLYAFMWQETSSETVEKVGYYSLKEGRVKWYPGKRTGMEEFIKNAVQSAEELAGEIRKGTFPPEPFKPTECRYCDHSPLCGASK
jgi:RecB family exonuclease